jgi:UDP-N-acetylglucosamine 2-epimerase (non-hydrolysing)/GDP/UDP-N,N'-diacetylbacillosamine 2-epimerase (hydrolysing)
MRLSIITNGRADEGIYLPLLKALDKQTDMPYEFGSWDELWTVMRWHYGGVSSWLIVLGDTMPMLKGVLKAVEMNIPIAHIHGGDRTGSIDDSIRHAITRFAHLHFPSIPDHADRLIRMGEESWRITVCGPLGIYAMPDAEYVPRGKLLNDLGLNEKPIIIVLQHPVSTESDQAGQQMKETLEAVRNPEWQPVVIYPNGEPGSDEMIKVITSYPYPQFKNLPYLQFLSLLKIASCMVGNSSSALVEAPLFDVRVVNIGTRQKGRTTDHFNAVNTGYQRGEIYQQVLNAIFGWSRKAATCSNYYFSLSVNPYLGFSDGPEIIIKRLRETAIDTKLLQKRLTY